LGAELEQKLNDRLTGLGYEPVTLRNAEDLKANLKTQLEKHNHIKLSEEFNQGVQELRAIATIPNDVNKLISEDDQVEFVKAFRNLIRLQNVSKSFPEFSFSDLNLDEQTFEDDKSKYLDIYDRTRSKLDDDKESLVEEVDVELELIQRDEINVSYILKLLANLQRDMKDDATQEDYQNQKASKRQIILRSLVCPINSE
jgi:type I restriction enzyme R subunit